MTYTYPTDVIYKCQKCGQCCGNNKQKTRHILLLSSDAQKICKLTKKSISEFAKETENKKPYIYEMHKDRKTGKCGFLEKNKCTIYEYRPLICRFYPFELTTDPRGLHDFEATLECPGIKFQSVSNDQKVSAKYFKELLDLAKKEIEEERN
jgi:Fe-S-cluster containining protein